KVEISAKIIKTDKGNFLQLTVFDEGGNFDKADLEKAMKKGIGLNNIRQRLKNYYGSLAQLEIFSEKGKGTEAKILLPLLEKNKSSVETKKFFGRINQ
ncbi:MAG: sensor histidine kinase, partial [Pyrinomonadaceae bacterium]